MATLVVERNPLGFSCSFDIFEDYFAVVSVDACYDYSIGCEILCFGSVMIFYVLMDVVAHCFLLECVSCRLCIFHRVCFALDGFPLSGFAGILVSVFLDVGGGMMVLTRSSHRHRSTPLANLSFCHQSQLEAICSALPTENLDPTVIIQHIHNREMSDMETHLVTHVQIGGLLRPLNSQCEPRLRTESPGIQWCHDPRLRPRTREFICPESNHVYFDHISTSRLPSREEKKLTVWSIPSLMTHQRIIALVRLQNRRRLQIILVKTVNHLF